MDYCLDEKNTEPSPYKQTDTFRISTGLLERQKRSVWEHKARVILVCLPWGRGNRRSSNWLSHQNKDDIKSLEEWTTYAKMESCKMHTEKWRVGDFKCKKTWKINWGLCWKWPSMAAALSSWGQALSSCGHLKPFSRDFKLELCGEFSLSKQ